MIKKIAKSNEKPEMIRFCFGLTRRQMDYLDGISKRCRYSGGKSFGKAAIIRSLLAAIKELGIDVKSVKTEAELAKRIRGAYCKGRK